MNGNSKKAYFTPMQWRIFFGCFFAYLCAYIARLNLSAALPSLMADLSLTDAQGGMLQTAFALTYAGGQLVNGAIADRISARRHIALGLLLSGVCNLAFGLSGGYWQLLVLWCLNGVAQSMLWTPIVKLMAVWYHGEARNRISFGMSMTLIAGHLAAWLISGAMARVMSWSMSFIVPAIVAITSAVVSYLVLVDGNAEQKTETEKGGKGAPIGWMLLHTGLGVILLTCVASGFVRDSVMTWAPTILSSQQDGMEVGAFLLTALVIPLINCAGVLLGRLCISVFRGNERLATGVLMGVGALLSLMLLLSEIGGVILCAVLLGLCCASMYGVNPLITSLIPMQYDKAGRVGMVAGMMDCFIYFGSALSGVASGALSGAMGWSAVYIAMAVFALLGALAAILAIPGVRKLQEGWTK